MKICIHSNQFDGRGTGKTPYDYGVALRDILGHEVCYITSSRSANEGLEKINKEFAVYQYDGYINSDPGENIKLLIEKLVDQHKIDFVHMIKEGRNDNATPTNCKTGIHYVFKGEQPHGDVYAAVSENLAKKYKQNKFIPHIIRRMPPSKNTRALLGIPRDALVVGRHGGRDSFDLPFVKSAIIKALDARKDIYFLFLSTNQFVIHNRVIHFDWVPSEQSVFNFIYACDIMLHARGMGETFGLSVAEFSACNRPVMTWTGKGSPAGLYDTAHIDHLQGKAFQYDDEASLLFYLKNIKSFDLMNQHWDMFTEKFSDKNVIKQYEKVFLK